MIVLPSPVREAVSMALQDSKRTVEARGHHWDVADALEAVEEALAQAHHEAVVASNLVLCTDEMHQAQLREAQTSLARLQNLIDKAFQEAEEESEH